MSRLSEVLSKIDFHAVYEKSIREAVDRASQHSFSSMQIETAMPDFFPEQCNIKSRREIRRYAEDKNVTLKVHAPIEDCSLQTLHAAIRQAVIKRRKEIIGFAGDLGAKLAVIHPGTVPAFTIPGKGSVPIDI